MTTTYTAAAAVNSAVGGNRQQQQHIGDLDLMASELFTDVAPPFGQHW